MAAKGENRAKKSRPVDPVQSPITFRPCANDEFHPFPYTERDHRAEAMFQSLVDEKASRLGISRRAFAQSACGSAAALFVFNQVYGCSEHGQTLRDPTTDAGYDVSPAMMEDAAAAEDALAGDEFIFDVQVHAAASKPPWTPDDLCDGAPPGCISPVTFIKEIFIASDTDVACLSGVPSSRSADPLAIEARARIKEIVDRLSGGPRLVIHANVRPNLGEAELDLMEEDARAFAVAAWKVYPSDGSWALDSDEVGQPFIERARKLGIKVIAAHRGISSDAGRYDDVSSPRDLAAAAKANPDIAFLAYHAGWEGRIQEDHPFDPREANPAGIDRMVKAVLDHGIDKNGNVYAELGSTWRNLMASPSQAAHALGKLLKYLGPDRIVWGTDCLFTGSPQEQIEAFRRFQIPEAMQETYGYPALTDEIRRKIFGLNAARVYGVTPGRVLQHIKADDISRDKLAAKLDPGALPLPRRKHYGPRTRREFFALRERPSRGIPSRSPT
ncbi:MAG: amidohydrolase [Myxococcales bacterium]|nr:amidohydrolase [Myxococcales bacterium]